MSNNEKLTETRYPFHGFYRPFVAEMEEIEAERAREQAVRQQPQALPTTAELLNALPTTSTDIERLPEPVTKTSPPGIISVPVQDDVHLEAVVPEVPNEEIQPTEESVLGHHDLAVIDRELDHVECSAFGVVADSGFVELYHSRLDRKSVV